MRRKSLVEGIILLIIGLVGMAEGLRLILFKDPITLYDKLGPGYYVLFLSIAMMITGLVPLVNYKINPGKKMEKVLVNREFRKRMFNMVGVLAIYAFLLASIGYLVATIIFFFLEFRVVGIKSWSINAILTLIVTAVYYIIFIQYCNLVFPRGIFFR